MLHWFKFSGLGGHKEIQRAMESFAPIKDPDLFNNTPETTNRLNKSPKHRYHSNKRPLTHPVENPELSLDTGDKVIHNTFGEGLVINCVPSGGDFELTVAFKDDHGIKRLLLSLAPIQKVE